MRMDFPIYIPVWREGLGKTSKGNKNNYRKVENKSKHNDFPLCGKNGRQERNAKGTSVTSVYPYPFNTIFVLDR